MLRVNERHEIASIIDGDIGLRIDHCGQVLVVILLTLTFVRPDHHIFFFCECCGDVILRRERIASGDGNLGSTSRKRAHKNACLLSHVERHTDRESSKWLRLREFFAHFQQCTHVTFGDLEIETTLRSEGGVTDVGHGDE